MLGIFGAWGLGFVDSGCQSGTELCSPGGVCTVAGEAAVSLDRGVLVQKRWNQPCLVARSLQYPEVDMAPRIVAIWGLIG